MQLNADSIFCKLLNQNEKPHKTLISQEKHGFLMTAKTRSPARPPSSVWESLAARRRLNSRGGAARKRFDHGTSSVAEHVQCSLRKGNLNPVRAKRVENRTIDFRRSRAVVLNRNPGFDSNVNARIGQGTDPENEGRFLENLRMVRNHFAHDL